MENTTKWVLFWIWVLVILSGSVVYVIATDTMKRDANINEVIVQLKSNGINVYAGTVESFVRIELSRNEFVNNVLTNHLDVIQGRVALYYLDKDTSTVAYYYAGLEE